MKKRQKRAFTLIELLLVISIIALLMSILVPAMVGARQMSRRILCANNLGQISTAMNAHASANEDMIIPAGEMLYMQPGRDVEDLWHVALLPYIAERFGGNILEDFPDTWFCPEDRDPYPRGFYFNPHNGMTSYALNGYYRKDTEDSAEINLGPAGNFRFSQVPSPSSCMLMGETSYAAQFYDAFTPGLEEYDLPLDGHHRMTSGFYHRGVMNVLFVDGHVEILKGQKCDFEKDFLPLPYTSGSYMFWEELRLDSAEENKPFWGPGY